MPVPDFSDPRPPYLQIAEDLRKQIKAGRYQPGDRLPSNVVLRAQYNSATETVRRSLAVLRDEGLVETHSTRGTFVLRQPAQAGRSPEMARLESALHAAESRLTRRIDTEIGRIDTEIAKLREELEYTQAQVMALERQGEGTVPRDRELGQ